MGEMQSFVQDANEFGIYLHLMTNIIIVLLKQ